MYTYHNHYTVSPVSKARAATMPRARRNWRVRTARLCIGVALRKRSPRSIVLREYDADFEDELASSMERLIAFRAKPSIEDAEDADLIGNATLRQLRGKNA